jgi:hypothetical protein
MAVVSKLSVKSNEFAQWIRRRCRREGLSNHVREGSKKAKEPSTPSRIDLKMNRFYYSSGHAANHAIIFDVQSHQGYSLCGWNKAGLNYLIISQRNPAYGKI